MLTGLWTIGIKVPDIEKELEFQKRIGNEIILDEKLELNNKFFRVPLIKMGDKYLHLAEEMVYEHLLDQPLPYGITHLVYVSNSFDQDVEKFIASGALYRSESRSELPRASASAEWPSYAPPAAGSSK